MVSRGIGIRFSAAGARILGLERTGDSLSVTHLAAGIPITDIDDFLKDGGISPEDSVVAFGLCPGDFLTASYLIDDTIKNTDIRDQLKWEIERKMISDPGEYFVDYAIADLGFVFAGLKNRVNQIKSGAFSCVTDVEPVALYNGCDAADEIGSGVIMLTSLEAEGVSTVLLNNGELVSIDSFPVREDDLAPALTSLDRQKLSSIGGTAVDHLAGYVMDSFSRVTKRSKKEVIPELIVLAGSGALVGDIEGMVKKKTGVATTLSNSFSIVTDDIGASYPDYSEAGAAFTTCFGLAVRALEE